MSPRTLLSSTVLLLVAGSSVLLYGTDEMPNVPVQGLSESTPEAKFEPIIEPVLTLETSSDQRSSVRTESGESHSRRIALELDCLPMTRISYRALDASLAEQFAGKTFGGTVAELGQREWNQVVVGSSGWEEITLTRDSLPLDAQIEARGLHRVHGRVSSVESGESIDDYVLLVEQGIEGVMISDPDGTLSREFDVKDNSTFQLGGFHLVPGWVDRYRLLIAADGFLPKRTEWQSIPTAGEIDSVEVQLERDLGLRVRVEGTVLSGTGDFVEGASCYLAPQEAVQGSIFVYEDGEALIDSVLDLGSGVVMERISHEFGSFSFEAQQPGEYSLVVVPHDAPAIVRALGYLELQEQPRQEEIVLSLPGSLSVTIQYPPEEDPDRYHVDLLGRSFRMCTPEDSEPGVRTFTFGAIEPGEVQLSFSMVLDPESPGSKVRLERRRVQIHEQLETSETFDLLGEVLNAACTVTVPEHEGLSKDRWVVSLLPKKGSHRGRRFVSDKSGAVYLPSLPEGGEFMLVGLGRPKEGGPGFVLALPEVSSSTPLDPSRVQLHVANTAVTLRAAPGVMGHQRSSILLRSKEADSERSSTSDVFNWLAKSGLPANESLRIEGLPLGTYQAEKANMRSNEWTLSEGHPLQVQLRVN